MKKLLLSALALSSLMTNAQIQIDNTDLQWTAGNEWYMTVHNVNQNTIDATTGTGKTWDFSGYTSTFARDTVRVKTGTTTDLDITSVVLKQNTVNASGVDYLQKMAAGIDMDNAVSIGLPHVQGKTWNSNISALNGFSTGTITSEVLAEGTVKFPWGELPVLMVQEHVQLSGPIIYDQKYYWFENETFGRVAMYFEGQLMIVENTSFNVITSNQKVEQANITLYPNPATNNVTVNLNGSFTSIEVYNVLGELMITKNVANQELVQLNLSELTTGQYFVKAIGADKLYTTSLIKK